MQKEEEMKIFEGLSMKYFNFFGEKSQILQDYEVFKEFMTDKIKKEKEILGRILVVNLKKDGNKVKIEEKKE